MATEISRWILDLDDQLDVSCISQDRERILAEKAIVEILATPGINLIVELKLLQSHMQQLMKFGKSFLGFMLVEEELVRRISRN